MKNKLATGLQRREGVGNNIRQILSAAKRAHRDLTAEEQTQVRELEMKVKNIDLDLLEELHESTNSSSADVPSASAAVDGALDILEEAGHDVDRLRERVTSRRAEATSSASLARGRRVDNLPEVIGGEARRPDRSVRSYTSQQARQYAAMFGQPQASQFESFSEFLQLLHHGSADPRFQAATMVEGIGADGGYLVPTEYASRLLDAALESEVVRPRARIEPMKSNHKVVAGFNTSNHQSSIGGFTAQWLGEGGAMTKQKGNIRALELKAKKLAILAEVSNELIADATDFEQALGPLLVQAISWYLDNEYLTGEGTQGPLGVIENPSTITVAKETSQVAATINYTNVVKMFARMHPGCVKNSVWCVNPATLPQLLALKQVITNVAGTENVGGSWVPVLREDGSGNMTLLTRPVVLTEKLPTLGTEGDIILCDFSQYIAGIRDGMSIKKSEHLGFDQDLTYYRIILRADGMSQWADAQTPKAGSTLSWCVTLATRA